MDGLRYSPEDPYYRFSLLVVSRKAPQAIFQVVVWVKHIVYSKSCRNAKSSATGAIFVVSPQCQYGEIMSDLLLVSCVHFDQSLKHVQPIAFGVSCNLNLQSQSPWSLFNGTWQKRPRELDHQLRFEIEKWHSKCNRLYLLTYWLTYRLTSPVH